MAPGLAKKDLLYVPAGPYVYVYSYPEGKHVATFAGFYIADAACGDSHNGHVFIVNYAGTFSMPAGVYIYAHGGTNPINVLPASGPVGCGVDPTSGDLAVGILGEGSMPASVLVYKNANGSPRSYTNPRIGKFFYCGYDDKGNLFADGVTSPSGTGDFILAELPKGGKSLEVITMKQYIGWPGQVQWDGKYLTIEDAAGIGYKESNIYRFTVHGREAARVGQINLGGAYEVHQSWIQDKVLLLPACAKVGGCDEIQYYKYPGGGLPFKKIKTLTYGVVVSLAPKR
jgi:hypothetical protein